MRKFSSAFLLACVTLLAACGDSSGPSRDPAPSADNKHQLAQARIATTAYGTPFEMDGCTVRMHRVYATNPGSLGKDIFTMATAECPTAKVTATQTSCGKSCKNHTMKIEPAAPAQSVNPTTALQKAKLKEQISKLEDARALANAQLEALEQSLPD